MAKTSKPAKKAHDAPKSAMVWDEWDFNITDSELPVLWEELAGALTGYEAKLYAVLAAIVAMALHLSDHPDAWANFCHHEFWRNAAGARPKDRHRDRSLKYVMRFGIGPTENDRKNANRYVRAIGPLVEEGVYPSDLAGRIAEEGGIVALLKKWKLKPPDRRDNDLLGSEDREGGSSVTESLNSPLVKKKQPKPASTSPTALVRKDSPGSSNANVYLPMKLLLTKKDRDDILASDPLERKLLFEIELSAIEDGEIVAKVDDWGDLETQEEARERLAQ